MIDNKVPSLSDQDIKDGLLSASNSTRRRHAKILHKMGDEFNRVFNFTIQESYMQPHLHPGVEKIEEIHVIQGKIAVLFFDNQGTVSETILLEKGGIETVKVPAFSWHTYVMLTESAISYETMMGKYDSKTWKEFAEWAPLENTPESIPYLGLLKSEASKKIAD